MELLVKRYQDMSNEKLPEDLRICFLVDLCPEEVLTQVEMNYDDLDYHEVRDNIMSFITRKRSARMEKFKGVENAMEVDEVQVGHEGEWYDDYEDGAQYGDAFALSMKGESTG